VPLAPNDCLLSGKVAVVTGAAVGIGQAIALAYANFGADVAICDRDVPNLRATADAVEDAGRRVVAAELDVRARDEVDSFLQVVRDQFHRVDILVNNAGGGFHAEFLDVSPKGMNALVRENYVSVVNFIRGTVPLMPATGGSIVNITSIEAHRAAPGYAIYSSMKAAVANLTQSLALELGSRLIRVNCIAPDVIPTPGIGGPIQVKTPLPRRGHVDDIAAAAVYLGGELSKFVTGTTLHVDGGNLAAGGWHRDATGAWST
jgi:NAD(P)-dependent dehydrogenase (short-subunit alcohol dehydrogenase family)